MSETAEQTTATSKSPNITVISQMINDSIAPAVMGDDYTVNANLDNIVDLGTAISALTPKQLEAPLEGLLRQVITRFDNRNYDPEDIPLYIEPNMLNATIQSIKAGFADSDPNRSAFALTPGQTYNEVNTYYGVDFTNQIYTQAVTWAYSMSIPQLMVQRSFLTPGAADEFIAMLNIRQENGIRRDSNALAHELLSALGLKGTTIELVTTYNSLVSNDSPFLRVFTGTSGTDDVNISEIYGTVTSENAIYNPVFMRWAAFTIRTVIEKARNATGIYNDGTIPGWLSNSDDTIVMLHSIFAAALDMHKGASSDIYRGNYTVKTTSYWNALGDNPVPSLEDSASIIYNNQTPATAEGNTKLDNVIAIVYDRYAAGYSYYDLPIGVNYNGAGRFYNYFYDKEARYYIDTRNCAITFTLN